jgi:carbon storage regulator
MLVISRRIGESFLIGDNIEATVVDITGEKVVLGINAPREVPISRLEVSEIRRQNELAGKPGGNINMNGFARLYKSRLGGGNKE